jgi:hypothetical protein
MFGGASGVIVPSAVCERIPNLKKDPSVLFYDFGTQRIRATASRTASTVPVVVVLSEHTLYIATFPSTAHPVTVIPLKVICGIERNGEIVTLKCSTIDNFELLLPKADTFVIHLIDVQDRRMNRMLHMVDAPTGAGEVPETAPKQVISTMNVASASPSPSLSVPVLPAPVQGQGGTEGNFEQANRTLREIEEGGVGLGAGLAEVQGVIRFGHASKRVEPPQREIDEGSDASSVQTIDHEVVEESIGDQLIDLPEVSIDTTSLYRRLWYFFLHYDRSKLRFIDDIIAQHRGMEASLLEDLQNRYGPEPHRNRWEIRDQLAHQREIQLQLKAQLARARDELLLLGHERLLMTKAVSRVEHLSKQMYAKLERHGSVSESESESRQRQSMDSSSAGFRMLQVLDKGREAYFPAPNFFFDFVAHQVQVVDGGTASPTCILRELSLTDLNDKQKTGSPTAPADRRVTVNRSLLGVWAKQYGDHSVAVQGSGGNGSRWIFHPSASFW